MDKETQTNISSEEHPMVPQVCSLGTKKDLNSMGSTMCGKRMSSFMVGNKKTLLSPTASLMRQRS